MKERCTHLLMSFDDIYDFINVHNQPNTTVIFYQHCVITQHDVKLIEFLQNYKELVMKIYIFTFDYWFHELNKKLYKKTFENEYLSKIFKCTNYKVFCFADNILTLNKVHGCDYTHYEHNIIFNNIWCCYNSSFCDFNKNPIRKLLVSGSRVHPYYWERVNLADIKSSLIEVYDINKQDGRVINKNYNMKLNKYYCCFASSVHVEIENGSKWTNTHSILLKNFSILASGALLVAPLHEAEYLEKIGLYHRINCYLIDFDKDIEEQIAYVFDNIEFFDNVRMVGQEHGRTHLNSYNKYCEIEKIIFGT